MIRRGLLLAGLVLALLPATAAADADTQINFEGLTAGQGIDTTYTNSGGVTFGSPQSFGVADNSNQCGAPSATTTTGGINGTQSAEMSCRSSNAELAERYLGTAFEFNDERQRVSFDLEQTIIASTTATVTFYGTAGNQLNQQAIALAQGQVVHVSYDHGSAAGGVADVVITDNVGYNVDGGQALLDDLDATLDTTSLTKEFSLALPTPSVDGVEGSTAQASVSVRRFNGSTGAVTLSAGALPPGVQAVQFSPNPVNGTAPATMTVTLDRPLTGQRQITINATGSASAGTQVGASKVQSVNATPAFTFAANPAPITLVPGCGPRTITEDVGVQGDYSGGAPVSVENVTGGLSVAVQPGSDFLGVDGNGAYPITVTADPGASPGGGTFDLRVDPYQATSATETVPWGTDSVSIDRTLASAVSLPIVDGGSTLDVEGNFPAACDVKFTDEAGQTWPVLKRSVGTLADGSFIDDLTLSVPSTAVSGPLTVTSPTGAVLGRTTPITVSEFRITDALSAVNSGAGAMTTTYSWDDFTNTFDDAEDCFIVCAPDPVAFFEYLWMRGNVTSGDGLCYGYSVMAARFAAGLQTPADYGTNTGRAWDIKPLTDSTKVKHDVVKWMVRQWDPRMELDDKESKDRSPGTERALLHTLISQNGAALILISQGSDGHAVLAYAVQDNPTVNGTVVNGAERVLVYNPNRPYDSNENTDAGLRVFNLAESSILIMPDGSWTDPSENWSGGNSTLRVEPKIPPDDGELPFSLSELEVVASAGSTDQPAITSVTAGGRALLNADGTPTNGSGIDMQPDLSGSRGDPTYVLSGGRSYTVNLRGTGGGSYEDGLVGGNAVATVSGASTAKGQRDQLTVQPGQATLGFRPAAGSSDATYNLAQKQGTVSRTASIALHTFAGGHDQTSLSGGAVTLTHDGPATTAAVTLGYAGPGLPSSVQTAPLSVGTGQSLRLTPRRWSDLSTGAGYVVKSASGKVLRRGTVRLRAVGKQSLTGVSAHRRQGQLTVAGRIGRPGADPLLAVAAQVIRGGKVLRSRSVKRVGGAVHAGHFSLSLAVGTVPAGARVKVTVLLVDQASPALASRQRQLTVH